MISHKLTWYHIWYHVRKCMVWYTYDIMHDIKYDIMCDTVLPIPLVMWCHWKKHDFTHDIMFFSLHHMTQGMCKTISHMMSHMKSCEKQWYHHYVISHLCDITEFCNDQMWSPLIGPPQPEGVLLRLRGAPRSCAQPCRRTAKKKINFKFTNHQAVQEQFECHISY